MATLNSNSLDNIIVPSVNGTTYRGLSGDDTYIISSAIAPEANITIVDTSGINTIQLTDGLTITSSIIAVEKISNKGFGEAINDRLIRAAEF